MKLANATKFDSKSGVAQRRDLQFALTEKRNQDAIRSRHFRPARKAKLADPSTAPTLRSEVVTFSIFSLFWWPESPAEHALIKHPRGPSTPRRKSSVKR